MNAHNTYVCRYLVFIVGFNYIALFVIHCTTSVSSWSSIQADFLGSVKALTKIKTTTQEAPTNLSQVCKMFEDNNCLNVL